jgi:hypothetical protein
MNGDMNEEGADDGAASPRFARGMSGPFGSYTEPVKTLVDEQTHAHWLRLCNSMDKHSSDVLRDVVYLLVHGKTPEELRAQSTRSLLASKGLNSELISLKVRA